MRKCDNSRLFQTSLHTLTFYLDLTYSCSRVRQPCWIFIKKKQQQQHNKITFAFLEGFLSPAFVWPIGKPNRLRCTKKCAKHALAPMVWTQEEVHLIYSFNSTMTCYFPAWRFRCPFKSFLHSARGKNLVRKRSVLNLLIESDDLFLTFQIVRGYEVTVLNFKPALDKKWSFKYHNWRNSMC